MFGTLNPYSTVNRATKAVVVSTIVVASLQRGGHVIYHVQVLRFIHHCLPCLSACCLLSVACHMRFHPLNNTSTLLVQQKSFAFLFSPRFARHRAAPPRRAPHHVIINTILLVSAYLILYGINQRLILHNSTEGSRRRKLPTEADERREQNADPNDARHTHTHTQEVRQ